ncbi:MAG: leucine-rich repeat protein [Eggerthellaceae bacterium]|nr:leucine-rich repeat protein [Eggerthellaceae bacterium]
MLKKIKSIIFKHWKEREKLDEFYKYDNGTKKMLREGDTELTQEQIEEINSFWHKYKFMYEIDYSAHKLITSRSGRFNAKYLPRAFYRLCVRPHFQDPLYLVSFKNKNYTDTILSMLKQPQCVVRRIRGFYFDANFQQIDISSAAELCRKFFQEKNDSELIVKSSVGGGGKGISFISKNDSDDKIKDLFAEYTTDFIVQQIVKQHATLAKISSRSVNTIRINSIIYNKQVVILSSFLRMGHDGIRVDNVSGGGIACSIKDDGTLADVAFNHDYDRVYEHISGFKFADYKIVGYEKAVALVKKAHLIVPQLGLLAWDFAIDEAGDPVFLEYNMSVDTPFAQCVSGPLLGDLTEPILDELLEKHYKERANFTYDYEEYYDHVKIINYVGLKKHVKIPEKIRNKPVTSIAREAFIRTKIVSVKMPNTIKTMGRGCFAFCPNLQKVILSSEINVIPRSAFKSCRQLEYVYIPETVRLFGNYAFLGTNNLIIHTKKGSPAYVYAEKRNIKLSDTEY